MASETARQNRNARIDPGRENAAATFATRVFAKRSGGWSGGDGFRVDAAAAGKEEDGGGVRDGGEGSEGASEEDARFFGARRRRTPSPAQRNKRTIDSEHSSSPEDPSPSEAEDPLTLPLTKTPPAAAFSYSSGNTSASARMKSTVALSPVFSHRTSTRPSSASVGLPRQNPATRIAGRDARTYASGVRSGAARRPRWSGWPDAPPSSRKHPSRKGGGSSRGRRRGVSIVASSSFASSSFASSSFASSFFASSFFASSSSPLLSSPLLSSPLLPPPSSPPLPFSPSARARAPPATPAVPSGGSPRSPAPPPPPRARAPSSRSP